MYSVHCTLCNEQYTCVRTAVQKDLSFQLVSLVRIFGGFLQFSKSGFNILLKEMASVHPLTPETHSLQHPPSPGMLYISSTRPTFPI